MQEELVSGGRKTFNCPGDVASRRPPGSIHSRDEWTCFRLRRHPCLDRPEREAGLFPQPRHAHPATPLSLLSLLLSPRGRHHRGAGCRPAVLRRACLPSRVSRPLRICSIAFSHWSPAERGRSGCLTGGGLERAAEVWCQYEREGAAGGSDLRYRRVEANPLARAAHFVIPQFPGHLGLICVLQLE